MSGSPESSPYVEKAAVLKALRETEPEREQAKKDYQRAVRDYNKVRERLRKLSR